MAVQAQYPSNALLLNRNEQERKNTDYSLQAQAAGLLDQSTILLTNGGLSNTNTRKRGREAISGAATQHPINLFSLRSQQQQQPRASPNPSAPTVISMSQLHTQPSLVSTGLHLSFDGHHQQQQQAHPLAPSYPLFSPLLTEDLASQIKHQKDEIDRFLRAQGEQLRRTLAESRQRHYRALLGLAEESAARRLREKEAEVEKAAHWNRELEERLERLRAESMAWQAKARADEVEAATLQAQLQHVAAGQWQDRGEDPPGCAAEQEAAAAEDAESAYVDPERRMEALVAASGPATCRACRRRAASVVLLPCRHLCVCRVCETAVADCPVCLCVRSASVEVYLS